MANPEPIPVLFTHHGEQWIRGSEQVLLDLLRNFDPARIKPVVWCNGTELAAQVEALGIPVIISDFPFYFDYNAPKFILRRYVSLVRQGLRIVRRHGIRVLHANGAVPAQWLVPVARLARLPLLAHLHTAYLRRGRFVNLAHQADLLVGVSAPIVRSFISDGMPAARTRVIHNGIDTLRRDAPESPSLRRQLGIPESAVVIATVGSLIHRKGIDILLRALGETDPSLDLRLIIAGDGPERAALEQRAAALGLAARVHYLGYVTDPSCVYRSSDMLAMPSRDEAFGLVLAEAGLFGLPVVATRVGGIPEVVVDGVTGLLVPPEDPEALAGALSALTRDEASRRALGRNGRERVERLFATRRMAAEFETAYETLAKRDRRQFGWNGFIASAKPYRRLFRHGLAQYSPALYSLGSKPEKAIHHP